MITIYLNLKYLFNFKALAILATSHKLLPLLPPNGVPISNKNLHKNLYYIPFP